MIRVTTGLTAFEIGRTMTAFGTCTSGPLLTWVTGKELRGPGLCATKGGGGARINVREGLEHVPFVISLWLEDLKGYGLVVLVLGFSS